jgi:hypothetical protein
MLFKKLVRICRDNGEGGGGTATTTVSVTKGNETFTREYVHELREENKGLRIKATENETRAKTAEESAGKVKTDSETAAKVAIADALKTSNERVIRAELKALATSAGIKNMDYLRLADVSTITLDADGNVVGADKIIEAMKKDMPDLFGTTSTTNPDKKPDPDDQKPKKATDMTEAEYAAAKKELLKKKS